MIKDFIKNKFKEKNKSESFDVEMLELERENADLVKRMKFVPGRDVDDYNRYIKNLKRLFEITGTSIHLINICRAEKKMHGVFTPLAKKCAIEAYDKNKNEKTLYFVLEVCLANLKPALAREKLDDIFSKTKKPELQVIKKIYSAGLANKEGQYCKANNLLSEFKKKYNGKVLWQSSFVITDFETGSEENYWLGNDSAIEVDNDLHLDNIKYVISVSCNKLYFDTYAEYFLSSVKESCGKDALVHIALVNMDKSYVEKKLKEWAEDLNISYKLFSVNEKKEIPVSATARLFLIRSLLKAYLKPVFYCEIDSAITKNLKTWKERLEQKDADHLIRKVGSLLPWRMYTCGFGLIVPTESGLKTASLIEAYCKGVFNQADKLVWADQAILEGAIRFSSITDSNYKTFSPSLKEISQFICTPTGSHYKKQKILKSTVAQYRLKNKRCIQVIGLQRSGTNFLTEVLKNSQTSYTLIETGNNYYAWKHALPDEKKMTNKEFNTVKDSLMSEEHLKIVLISKHPLWWLSSILNRNPADIVSHRSHLLDENGNIDPIKAIDFYLLFYRSWISSFDKNKLIHIKYEDILNDAGNSLQKIDEQLGMGLTNDLSLDEIKVKYSKGSFSEKKDFYLNSRLDLDEKILSMVKDSVSEKDEVFIKDLGYTLQV
ncbi:hypothetical protein EKK97_12810 [Billgrantia tianxiuensis]|uniref:Sulfotransferase domain-containing protein n=2 Tax=Halomonadaceae TaxID=28256 RepID=A0A6I6SHY6_9GAMM|nr:hypothetical protein [Halomonas tianxiuensis]QHC50288.1 hypothetical protein EKK97_12810 [Halomonas tianxiuensis]